MSSLTHSDHQATPEDLYRLACCGFHQAKCLLESLVTPTDEVHCLDGHSVGQRLLNIGRYLSLSGITFLNTSSSTID